MVVLGGIGDWVREIAATGGYPGLAAAILLENVFPPIPSEVILPLAGFYVGTGQFTFALALPAATAGSVAGALVLYGVGRRGGRPLAVLRAAGAGETFTITVRGRSVARVVPAGESRQPRTDVDRTTLRRILAEPLDDGLAAELDAAEAAVDDPWPAA